MNEISFYVKYETKLVRDISNLMRGYGLGISEVTMPVEELWSWETSSEITRGYIRKMKNAIRKILFDLGCNPISIRFETKEEGD